MIRKWKFRKYMLTWNWLVRTLVNELLENVAPELLDAIWIYLKTKLEMDKPTPRLVHGENSQVVDFDGILSKFHNPIDMKDLFEKYCFEDTHLLWYHAHHLCRFCNIKSRTFSGMKRWSWSITLRIEKAVRKFSGRSSGYRRIYRGLLRGIDVFATRKISPLDLAPRVTLTYLYYLRELELIEEVVKCPNLQ